MKPASPAPGPRSGATINGPEVEVGSMKRQSRAEAGGAESNPPPFQPAEVAARLKADIRNLANSPYWAALEAARATPVAGLLDELALHDFVALQMWVPRDGKNEHARQTWESIENTKSAAGSMKANYWLRRAMVYSKDFMLWDDAIKGEKFNPGRPKGAIGPVARKIKAYLKKHPKAKAKEVWDALQEAPPKGFSFKKTARLGRYIEEDGRPAMEYPRFQNLVWEHRPK